MRFPKFVVVENIAGGSKEIILGYVENHFQLLDENHADKSLYNVLGGGLFYPNHVKHIVYFYDKSFDYGRVPNDILKEILIEYRDKIIDDLYYLDEKDFSDYVLECEDIPYSLL